MSRFPAVEQRLHQGVKGLKLVCTYIGTVRKEIETFRKSLVKASIPLAQFLQLSKSSDDSLYRGMNNTVEGVGCYSGIMEKTCGTCVKEILEPVEAFVSHYEHCSTIFLNESARITDAMNASKAKVNKGKEKYSKCAQTLAGSLPTENPEMVKTRTKAVNDAKEEYQGLLSRYNVLMAEKQNEYRKQLELLEQNEKARMNLVAKSLAQMFALTDRMYAGFAATNMRIAKALEAVNPASDFTLFIADLVRQPQTETFARLVFEEHGDVYQHLAALNSKKPLPAAEPPKSLPDFQKPGTEQPSKFVLLEGDEDFVQTVVAALLSNKEITEKDRVHMSELLRSQVCRHRFAHELAKLGDKHFVANYAVFETLGEMVNSLLTMYSFHKDTDSFIIWTAMTASFLVYSTKQAEDGTKCNVTLLEFTSGNSLWRNKDHWISLIQYKVGASLTKAKQSTLPTGKDKALGSATSKESVARRALVFADLGGIAVQMALMAVEKDMGRSLLIQFASYYGVDSIKLNQLLSDFEGAQPLPRDTRLTPKELRSIIELGAKKTRERFAGKKSRQLATMLRLALDLRLLGDLRTLSTILMLNRELGSLLKKKVHLAALRLPGLKQETRLELWKQAIRDRGLMEEYGKIKGERLAKYLAANNGACETIKLDVIRSFHDYTEAAQEVGAILA